MHRRLTDEQIERTCRELLVRKPSLSGRALRLELKTRFGAVGRADRVFAIWRAMIGAGAAGTAGEEGGARLRAAQVRAEAAERRAELAEERERAHQDRWASEVYELRARLQKAREGSAASGLVHQRYHEALVQIAELRRRVGDLEGRGTPSRS